MKWYVAAIVVNALSLIANGLLLATGTSLWPPVATFFVAINAAILATLAARAS